MNIFILGAQGFVGSCLSTYLLREKVSVWCGGRDLESLKKQFPGAKYVECDFLKATSVLDWLPLLKGIDVLVNCVGIFKPLNTIDFWTIHHKTPQVIYEAALKQQVKQIIHISALGIEKYDNDYALSKKAIEDFLNQLSIPHVILRPSMIYGKAAGGSMGLINKLAALPLVLPLPGQGNQLLQPIFVGDLVKAISHLIQYPPKAPALNVHAVCEEKIKIKDILFEARAWLGFKTGYVIHIPMSLIKIGAKLGDLLSFPLLNSAAIGMLQQGNCTTTAEAKTFQAVAGFKPLNFKDGLNQQPASKADKWYIQLLLLKPLLRFSLVILWIFSGFISLLSFSRSSSLALLQQVGIHESLQHLFLYAASILNLLIGFWLLTNYKVKSNCLLQLIIILAYTLILTLKIPRFWLEPFGPVLKNIPIMLSVMILYVLET